jgi:DNA polymerase-3 subunit epsilon
MPKALIIDVETTGLTNNDEIIELAAILFEYDDQTKKVGKILDTYSGLREPRCPISPQAQKINRITDEMVIGQKLDDQRIQFMLASSDLVIAHNAKFDRSFLARLYPEFSAKTWRCSMTDIDWAHKGHAFQSLEKLAKDHEIKIGRGKAHRALGDCETVYNLLAVENNLDELIAGLESRIVELSPSGEELYPVQIDGEQKYFRSLEEIAGFYDETEGCEIFEQAFLYIDENPRDLEHYVVVKINDISVGYLKPGNAKTYRKRLAELGAPINTIGVCSASIRGGKLRGDFKTGFGVRLDFMPKEFEILPYKKPSKSIAPVAQTVSKPTMPQVVSRPTIPSVPMPQSAKHHATVQAQPVKIPLLPWFPSKNIFYIFFIFPFVATINLYILFFWAAWQIIKKITGNKK